MQEGLAAEAWVFANNPDVQLDPQTWRAVADGRAADGHPQDALTVWLLLVDRQLQDAGRDHYLRAIDLLTYAAEVVGRDDPVLRDAVARLREQHARRPTFLKILAAPFASTCPGTRRGFPSKGCPRRRDDRAIRHESVNTGRFTPGHVCWR